MHIVLSPPSATSEGEVVESYTDLRSLLEDRVQVLADQQDELSQLRAQLLVDRERAQSFVKRIRQQRDVVKEEEARLMDAFREHDSKLDEPLSEGSFFSL